MTVGEAQRSMSSIEFVEWVAFYGLEAEMTDLNREPTPDELGDKFRDAFAVHNAKLAAKGQAKVKREPR